MKHCLRLFDLLALLLLAYVFYSAFTKIYIPWDSWSYHLPFASYLWGIGGGVDGYRPTIYTQAHYLGFPLLAEWIQGALWALFDDIRATSLINPIALFLYCLACRYWLKTPFYFVLIGALCFPIIAVHSVSTYKDLFTGALAATSVIAAASLYANVKEQSASIFEKKNRLAWVVFSLTSIACANAKPQGWYIIIPHVGLFSLLMLWQLRKGSCLLKVSALLFVVFICCNYTQISNLYRLGQPFYPLVIKGFGHVIMPESAGVTSFDTRCCVPSYAGTRFYSQPVYFLTSVFELDNIIKKQPTIYNIDMNSVSSDQSRTGGLWAAYMAVHLMIIVCFYRRSNASCETLLLHRYLLFAFGIITVLLMFMPMSNFMRYVMVWPLLLLACSGMLIANRLRNHAALAGLLLTICFFTSQALISDRPLFGGWRAPANQQEWRDSGNPAIISRLKDGQTTCLEVADVEMHLWFRYSAAVIGGTHVIQAPPDFDKTCADLPH